VRTYSITRRLIATILLIELSAALCVAGIALVYERHMHFRAFEVLLRGRADSLLGAVQDAEDANDNVMLDGTEIAFPSDDIYEVEDDRGRVLGHSVNWPQLLLSGQSGNSKAAARSTDSESFFQTTVHGRTYRVIKMHGLRIVDPGDKGGGIRRNVVVYYGSSVDRVWQAALRTAAFYAVSGVLVLSGTGFLLLWLMNRALAPLCELTVGASKVSATSWTFLAPQEARKVEELAPLVSALEALLGGLQQAFEQQKRFVGDAAHELKTSAAVVKSSLQLLGMKQRTAQEYQAGIERCLADCGRMEGIVAQMLTLARVEESGATESLACSTEIYCGLQKTAEELWTMAEIGGVAICIQGDHALQARIDPRQFNLLCTNLLMNALQHSPANSGIAANVGRQGDFAQMTIRDQGDGIAPQDLPRIFERFSRSDSSRSRKTGGTGLGLAICKAIVDNCHGTIEIQSEPGAGTTVIVQLPLADVIPAPAENV
jgi:signal transduction histidine kinase